MNKLVWLLPGIALIAGGGYFYRHAPRAKGVAIAADLLAPVRVGDVPITVVENGFLKARNSVKVETQFEREGKISWIIAEGTAVKEGETLVDFEKTEIEDQITELEQKLIQYEAELEAARADLQIQERDSKAEIEKAEMKRGLSALGLERYEKGEYPNELRKQSLAEEKARSEFERAKERYEQVPKLQEEGFLTKIQVEEERIRLREAEINLENATRERELLEKYTHVMDSTQKNSDLKDAERELENSQQKATIGLSEKQAVLTQRERQLQSTQKRLEAVKKERDMMTLRAPSPGIVHYGDADRPWMRDEVKVGNSLWHGQTVITLPDLREMQVVVQVHEAEIDKVKEGMPAVVTVETHKDRSFAAKVTKIASVASSRNWTDAGNRSFQVEITMDPIDIELRAGVTARAEIQVDVLKGVLHVPIHAVLSEGGERFCFTHLAGVIERRVVTVGRNNAHLVEVGSGMREGEQVLLYDPRLSGFVDKQTGVDGGVTPAAAPAAAPDATPASPFMAADETGKTS